jgi:hypothetical protein
MAWDGWRRHLIFFYASLVAGLDRLICLLFFLTRCGGYPAGRRRGLRRGILVVAGLVVDSCLKGGMLHGPQYIFQIQTT